MIRDTIPTLEKLNEIISLFRRPAIVYETQGTATSSEGVVGFLRFIALPEADFGLNINFNTSNDFIYESAFLQAHPGAVRLNITV